MNRRGVLLGGAACLATTQASGFSQEARLALLGGVSRYTPGQAATLARLRTANAAALISNPVDNAELALSPAQSASHDATLTVQANYNNNPSSFTVSSGRKYVQNAGSTNALQVATASPFGDTGNLAAFSTWTPALINSSEQMLFARVSNIVTAQVVEYNLRAVGATSPYQLIVDDRYVLRNGFVATSSFQKFDFGSTATRKLMLEMPANSNFRGLSCSAGGTIGPLTETIIKGVCAGDSVLEALSTGESAIYPWDTFINVSAKQCGINSMMNTAVGGTGYVNNATTRRKIYDQMDNWINQEPAFDVIDFAAGGNDAAGIAQVAANALLCFQRARAAHPNALIRVFGINPEATGPNATTLSLEAAVKAAYQAWGDRFSMFIPISNDPTGSWVTGTGYVGHTTGVGNSDTVTSADGVHPAHVAGQVYLGGKVTTAYRALLAAM